MAAISFSRGRVIWGQQWRRLLIGFALAGVAAACSNSTPTSPSPTPTPTPPPTAGDPAPPSLTCPADVTTPSPSGSSVAVAYTPPTATGGVAPVTVSCAPAPGTSFQIGTTTVRCTATAANLQTGSCSFTVTVTPPVPRLARTRMLAFGDSLTEGEVTVPQTTGQTADGSPSFKLVLVPQAAYPTQLQLLLRGRYTAQTSAIAVTNSGRSGERATEGARRFPDVVANLRPEVVLLLAGANDLAGLGNAGVTPAVLAVESMAKEARFRNARVFIATLTPPRPGASRALPASLVQTYNSRLESIARGEGAVFVDLYAALLTNLNVYIGVDGLHPTEAGYRRMADAFFDAILQDLEVR